MAEKGGKGFAVAKGAVPLNGKDDDSAKSKKGRKVIQAKVGRERMVEKVLHEKIQLSMNSMFSQSFQRTPNV
ncbi:envelope glycoprotein [Bienertia sinuspersici]